MIVARLKNSGIFAIVFNLFLCLVVLWAMYIMVFQVIPGNYPHTSKRSMPPALGFVFLPFFGVLLFFMIYSLRHYVFFIKIDPDCRTIAFRNILSFQKRVYDFSEFDCYLEALMVSKGGSYRSIYLIKGEKAEKIITGMYYENIEELKTGLSSIKYLGFQKNFSMKALREILNSPVADQAEEMENP